MPGQRRFFRRQQPARAADDRRHHGFQLVYPRAQEFQAGNGRGLRPCPPGNALAEAAEGEQRKGIIEDLANHRVEIVPRQLPHVGISDDFKTARIAAGQAQLSLYRSGMKPGLPAPARRRCRGGAQRFKRLIINQQISRAGFRRAAQLKQIAAGFLDGARRRRFGIRPDLPRRAGRLAADQEHRHHGTSATGLE